MREIRCRVFFYDGKDYSTGEWLSAEEAWAENYIEWDGDRLVPTDKCSIIVEGTGLKDKNGREVFEGDIVHITSHRTDVTAPVIYTDRGFTVDGLMAGHYPNGNHHSEVIGNIYENPELLEEPK